MVHPHDEIPLSNKKEITSDNPTGGSQMHNAKWRRPDSKDYILYDLHDRF